MQFTLRIVLFHLLIGGGFNGSGVSAQAQEFVPIGSFREDADGQAQVRVASTTDAYYVLEVRNAGTDAYHPVALARGGSEARGGSDSTALTEAAPALPRERYRVRRYSLAAPADTDGDGIDDLADAADPTRASPLNPARAVEPGDGAVRIPDLATFERFALAGDADDPGQRGYAYLKIYITENTGDSLAAYFLNAATHVRHLDFARAVGIPTTPNGVSFLDDMRGTIVFHPEVAGSGGRAGLYTFHFGSYDDYSFEIIERTYDRLVANLPFLAGELAYRPLYERALRGYARDRARYDASRIRVVLEDELLSDVGYVGLNPGVGFGRLRLLEEGARPSPFDVVILDAIPNELPRVAGIISAVAQTPLSHVNLRAIQDGVPNAFVRAGATDPRLAALLGAYVRLEVSTGGFEVREASRAEVDAHFDARRPDTVVTLPADLTVTEIRPLGELGFDDAISVGAKAANLAQLGQLGFPEGVIPEGFAVPFSFYEEFMRANGLDDAVEAMLADPSFGESFAVQEERLEDLRAHIERGIMPPALFDKLTAVQEAFGPGAYIRCRSSTNNEDLPGFGGAGLYDSKTQRPDEGHLTKSIREVFASLWNYRAFVERDYYGIDHRSVRMGVLLHPSFREERVNGVAVSLDPRYGTEGSYYVNAQAGEDLVTNPDATSVPEELLVEASPAAPPGFRVVRRSNRAEDARLLLDTPYIDQLRTYLGAIDAAFATLYRALPDEGFAMEIEFKVDSGGRLAIKQARPWVGFRRDILDAVEEIPGRVPTFSAYPNPFSDRLSLGLGPEVPSSAELRVYDALGRQVLRRPLGAGAGKTRVLGPEVWSGLPRGGVYFLYLGAPGEPAASTVRVVRR